MANEITTRLEVTLVNGDLKEQFKPGIIRSDQATAKVSAGTQTIGTTAENLRVGDVSSFGKVMILSLDATNFVQYGVDSTGFVSAGRIPPGELMTI